MRHAVLAIAFAALAVASPAAAQRDIDVISARLTSIEQALREGATQSSPGVVYAQVKMRCVNDRDCSGTALTFCNKGLFRSGVPTKIDDDGWLIGVACVK